MTKIRTAVVGMGYWGSKFAKNLAVHPKFELTAVVDINIVSAKERLDLINADHTLIIESVADLLRNVEIDFVHIAVPPEFHYQVAIEVIESSKHVLIEKPVGLNFSERLKIVNLAREKKVRLFVDHTYLFTPEFNEIIKHYKNHEIGDLIFFNSTRINLGLIQLETNVIEDLAVHDLAILDIIRPELPKFVVCTGIIVPPAKHVSTAFATLTYSDGFIAQFMISWNSPVKVREIQIAGKAGVIMWDDMAGSDKVKIYNSKISENKTLEHNRISYHIGEGRILSIVAEEAIKRELDYISQVFDNSDALIVNGPEHILRVGRTLDALVQSVKLGGSRVEL
jgi:predicted dehydrogenase